MRRTNQISYCLWMYHQAEEAARFYTSLFKDSEMGEISYYGKEGYEVHHQKEGTVLTASFRLCGQDFMALNGGPVFKMNPSISFTVICEDEEEIDQLWKTLSVKGKVLMGLDSYDWSEKYGWVQDRYGLSWQLMMGNVEDAGQKIVPVLMFAGKNAGRAREAIYYYTDIFRNSDIRDTIPFEAGEGPEEHLKHAEFALEGQVFMARDGESNAGFNFSEGVSLMVNCHSQREIDYFWERLKEAGDPQAQQCGWLKDKYGVSWQVAPVRLQEMLLDPDQEKRDRVMKAYLPMKKFDLEELERAYRGKDARDSGSSSGSGRSNGDNDNLGSGRTSTQ